MMAIACSRIWLPKEGHCRLLAVAGRAVAGGASQMTDQAEIARIKNIYAEQEARLATPERCIPRHWGPGGIAQSGSADVRAKAGIGSVLIFRF